MPTILEQLAALDFTAIDDALGRVRVAVSADGDLDLGALDVTTLLGDVAPLVDAVRQLDADGDALVDLAHAALESLGELVRLPDVSQLGALAEGMSALAGLIAELAGVFATGDGTGIVDRLLVQVGGSLDLAGLVSDVAGRAVDALTGAIPEPLSAAFGQLARLGAGTADPAALAEIVLQVIAGLDLAAVAQLADGLDAAVVAVEHAGDTSGVAGLLAEIDAASTAAVALSADAPAGGDGLDQFVAVLTDLAGSVDRLAAVELPRFVDGLTTDLRTARNTLTDLDLGGRIDTLLEQLPRPGVASMDMVVAPLRDLVAGLGAVTSESITAALAEARGEVTAFVSGDLGRLLDAIDDAQRRVVRLIRSIPAEAVRDTIVTALRDAQREVLSFSGFSFLDTVVAPVRELASAIGQLDTSAITDAATGLVDSVNAVFADFPIEDLRDAVDAVIGPIGAILDEAGPVLTEVTAQIEALVGQLDAIDFEAAGAEVVELLAAIRTQVQDAVGSGDVPEPLQAVIAGAASVLKAMDLSVELRAPFATAVARIDVAALLEPVTKLWDGLRSSLERATPEALIAELDPPFDELLGRLDTISLAPLTDALGGLFGELLLTLQRVDPRQLVAPLQTEFDQLVAAVRGAVDPAPLFAPLRAAYEELHGAITGIDVVAAVNELVGGLGDSPALLTTAVSERIVTGGPVAVPDGDAQFRFGDIVRPLVGLVAEVRSRLRSLVGGAASAGLGQLAAATRTLRALLDPAAGTATRVADHLDARRGWFDASRGDGPLGAVAARLAGLDAAIADLDLDAAARARVDTAVGGVSLRARLSLDVAITAPAIESMDRTRETAQPAGLGRSIRLLTRALDDLLPAPLVDATLDPNADPTAFVDALCDAIDPAPLAAELDALGDQIMATLAGFVDELSVGLLQLWNEFFAGIEPLMPASVAARVQAVVDAIADELAVLDPGVIEAEARAVIDATVGLLDLFSPARLAGELGAVFDAALAVVADLDPAALLGGLDPFAELRTELAALRPSIVLAPLVEQAGALTASLEVVAALDLDIVGDLAAGLEAAFEIVLDGVEREWNSLLDELSSLGGSVSVSASVGGGGG